LSLSDFLIMPVQRVPRYEMLLSALIANTAPSDADMLALQVCATCASVRVCLFAVELCACARVIAGAATSACCKRA
jgi:hypothetical protein